MLSVAIVIQACQLPQLVSSKLCIEKAVNSDCIKRCCVICRDRDPRASGGESCIVQYFQGRHWVKNLFQRKKIHGSEVSYAQVGYRGFYCTSVLFRYEVIKLKLRDYSHGKVYLHRYCSSFYVNNRSSKAKQSYVNSKYKTGFAFLLLNNQFKLSKRDWQCLIPFE